MVLKTNVGYKARIDALLILLQNKQNDHQQKKVTYMSHVAPTLQIQVVSSIRRDTNTSSYIQSLSFS